MRYCQPNEMKNVRKLHDLANTTAVLCAIISRNKYKM